MVDPLPLPLLHPHPRASRAAAHPLAVVLLHLRHRLAGDRLHDPPALVIDLVVAAQVAGVVVGDHRVVVLLGDEASIGHQAVQQLSVVNDLDPGQPELRVFVADRVEAVRAAGHDGPHAVLVVGCGEGGHVLLGQHLEQVLVAGPPCRVSRACLAAAEHRERHVGLLEQGGHGPHHLAVAVIERAGAADPVQDAAMDRAHVCVRVCVRAAVSASAGVPAAGPSQHWHVHPLCPVETGAARLAPGVAGGLHVAERDVELLREAALLQHQVAPDLDDAVHVLDQDRAALYAPAAGGALPDRLLGNGVVDQGQREGVTRPLSRGG